MIAYQWFYRLSTTDDRLCVVGVGMTVEEARQTIRENLRLAKYPLKEKRTIWYAIQFTPQENFIQDSAWEALQDCDLTNNP